MSDAALGEERKAESDSVSTEDSFVVDGVHDSGIELRGISPGDEEHEGQGEEGGDDAIEEEDLLVSYKDSEKLVSQDSPGGGWTRALYSDSSKCCKTKASIVISKGMFLLVGVAVLVAGAVLGGTVGHHTVDGDQCYSNSSLVYQSISPTMSGDIVIKTSPNPSSGHTVDASTLPRPSRTLVSPTPNPTPSSEDIGSTSLHRTGTSEYLEASINPTSTRTTSHWQDSTHHHGSSSYLWTRMETMATQPTPAL
jgi:hypothetical protein